MLNRTQRQTLNKILAKKQDLADKIKKEQWFDFDVAIAEPKMMLQQP